MKTHVKKKCDIKNVLCETYIPALIFSLALLIIKTITWLIFKINFFETIDITLGYFVATVFFSWVEVILSVSNGQYTKFKALLLLINIVVMVTIILLIMG